MCVVDRTKIQRRGIRSLDSRGNSGISGGESNGSMQAGPDLPMWRPQGQLVGGGPCPFLSLPLSSPPLPCPSLPSPLSPPLPSPLPLEVGPLIQLGGLGSAVSSPSGVWGEAPTDKRFGAYLSQKEPLWWQQILWIFVALNE